MSKFKYKSLASEINDLVTSKSIIVDSDEENEETKAKVTEAFDEDNDSEDDFKVSDLRTRNITSLDKIDKRYAGKKISRKDLRDSGSSDFESDESMSDGRGSGHDAIDNISDQELSDASSNEEKSDNEDVEDVDDGINEEDNIADEDEDYTDDEEDVNNPLYRNRGKDHNFRSMSKFNVEEEIEKGNCVRHQIKLFENLLEARIKFQKCLITSNQLPQYDVYAKLKDNEEYVKEVNGTKDNLSLLLDKLLDLQSILLEKNPNTKNLNAEANQSLSEDPMDEEIPSDTDEEIENGEKEEEKDEDNKKNVPRKKRKLEDYEQIISRNHKSFTNYRNAEIQKWNDKTRIATVGSKKGSDQPVVQQIDFILKDKSKLIKRTQLKRSQYDIVGKTAPPVESNDGRHEQEYDTEIYDDDDFYHELLRQLIQQKTSDMNDPIQLSKQWIQLESMRNKMKRKIDTRATKGRRLRYNVHQKLVNFMAPILVNDSWSDHAKDELYSSLFGKIKPANNNNNNNQQKKEQLD